MPSMRIMVVISVLLVLLAACAPEREQQQPEETLPAPEEAPSQQPRPAENYAISVVSAPEKANAGEPLVITWKVSGPETTISHTAIHYDISPHMREFGQDTTAAIAAYPSLTSEFAQGSFKIPREFAATITPPEEGGIYWRAHALIGGKNYWTGERIIKVAPSPVAESAQTTSYYTIEADDSGFYMRGEAISLLEVAKDGNVGITFKVRDKNVYFGGLDFRSSKFETEKAEPGGEINVTFAADKDFTITSYWPQTSRKKADLAIAVK